MAKNNLFLGSGSGSVGDVVLMRRNGQQVARVRVREIANPKSEGQATQRSVFSPVSKFYAPLAGVLEKSWEGKNRADSQAAFLKANISLARENNWARPKGEGFFPLPFQLSNGTLPALSQSFGIANDLQVSVPGLAVGNTYFAQLSQALVDAGYQEGDQLTLLFVIEQVVGSDIVYAPLYQRVYIDTTSGDTIAEAFSLVNVTVAANKLTMARPDMFAAAVIVSRYERDAWRRSVSYLQVDGTLMQGVVRDASSSIQSYMSSSSTPTSDVYLNGNGAASDVPAGTPSIRSLIINSQSVAQGSSVTINVSTSASAIPVSGYVNVPDAFNYTLMTVSFMDNTESVDCTISSSGEISGDIISAPAGVDLPVVLRYGSEIIGEAFATIKIVEV